MLLIFHVSASKMHNQTGIFKYILVDHYGKPATLDIFILGIFATLCFFRMLCHQKFKFKIDPSPPSLLPLSRYVLKIGYNWIWIPFL